MSKPLVCVVKIGGSLLNLPDWSQRLQDWLANQSPAHHVLVVGGGRMVEHIRQRYQAQPGDENAAHWLCVDLMRLTAEFVSERLSMPLLDDFSQLQERLAVPGHTLFSVPNWLRCQEPTQAGTRLSEGWDVTSDAIAARLAVALDADELVLLKSAWPDAAYAGDLEALSAAGYVDPTCPRLAHEIPPWRLVNLRN